MNNNGHGMAKWEKFYVILVPVMVAVVVGWVSGRVTTAQQLGERPDRQELQSVIGEVKQEIKDTRAQIQREMDYIKERQDRQTTRMEKLQDGVTEILRAIK